MNTIPELRSHLKIPALQRSSLWNTNFSVEDFFTKQKILRRNGWKWTQLWIILVTWQKHERCWVMRDCLPVLGWPRQQLSAHQSLTPSQLPPGRWKREQPEGNHTSQASSWGGQQSAVKLVLSSCMGGLAVVELARNRTNFLALHTLHKQVWISVDDTNPALAAVVTCFPSYSCSVSNIMAVLTLQRFDMRQCQKGRAVGKNSGKAAACQWEIFPVSFWCWLLSGVGGRIRRPRL